MIRVNFDGACTPVNPGGIGTWGFVIDFGDGTPPLKGLGVCDDGKPSTNNVAEYWGLIEALAYLVEHHHGKEQINILGDSALVVNMANGLWGRKKTHEKAPHLIPLLENVKAALKSLRDRGANVSLQWVKRENNVEADTLTKTAYKIYANKT